MEKCEGEVTGSETGDSGDSEAGESCSEVRGAASSGGYTCCCWRMRDSTSLMTSSVMSGGRSITVISPVLRLRGESGE